MLAAFNQIPLQPYRESLRQVCTKLEFLQSLSPYRPDLCTISELLSQVQGMDADELIQQANPNHCLIFGPMKENYYLRDTRRKIQANRGTSNFPEGPPLPRIPGYFSTHLILMKFCKRFNHSILISKLSY